MKSLSWAVLGLLLCVPFAGAEVIDSVSFNPARLGRYETLKVSDQLTTKGGIEANAVTVQSGGTVSVNNAGNYKFPVTEVLGSVDMKSTDFEADTLNSRGTASFENKSSSAESKISTLNTSTADVRANILDLTNVTVPTGGSFTLGENAIPEPGQECSNLRWVERTTDDNYKYKVLAFGACKGEECNVSCGEWKTIVPSSNLFAVDTCDGNTKEAFTCSTQARMTPCFDVMISQNSSSGGQTNGRGYEIEGGYWDAQNLDTCDGNLKEEYTCSEADLSSGRECVDVYTSVAGSQVYTSHGSCPTECSFPAMTSCSIGQPTSVNFNTSQYIATHGIDNFCETYVLPKNTSSCQGPLRDGKYNSSSFNCGCWNNVGTYYYGYACKIRYFQQKVTCKKSSSSATYMGRTLTCCNDGNLCPVFPAYELGS